MDGSEVNWTCIKTCGGESFFPYRPWNCLGQIEYGKDPEAGDWKQGRLGFLTYRRQGTPTCWLRVRGGLRPVGLEHSEEIADDE